jgi:hypothetical protein
VKLISKPKKKIKFDEYETTDKIGKINQIFYILNISINNQFYFIIIKFRFWLNKCEEIWRKFYIWSPIICKNKNKFYFKKFVF